MASARKICVVTGTRAEYGLLFWLMREIENDPTLDLQLIVTGTHLEPRFGNTVEVIEQDGFRIDARVALDLSVDTPAHISAAAAKALAGVGDALAALSPDLVVLLGDRYEILAAGFAASLHRVPIAHLHGGEVTEGAIDDAMRHAITKLASLHFAAADPYRARIVQMGELPASVFTTGAPGLDHLTRTALLDADATRTALEIEQDKPYFLITVHPATHGEGAPTAEIDALLGALDGFKNHIAVFTGVNADSGRDAVAGRIDAYVVRNPERARLFNSLGQTRYLSAMKFCAAVIGNSSSGIIEAPALDVPTVNIGPRQQGRLRAASVVDCDADATAVSDAISRVIDPAFAETARHGDKPYGRPGASARIAAILRDINLAGLARKSFYDLPSQRAAS
ncbi:MAG: UDP-N-acetylglucosamine 2-epimerase [Rhodospirillales bacterium]